jgi:diacylglycerol kinase (ATP)
MGPWLVAVNPLAGRRPPDVERVRGALAAAGVAATVHAPADLAGMRRLLIEAVHAPHVAVVGGDGTVNLAVNCFYESGASSHPVLGVLPVGTGCDLMRTFGIPQDIEGAVRHLATDATYRVDVGEVEGSFGVRRFVNVAQAGVGAAAAQTAVRFPRRWGTMRYMAAFGVRLPRFPAGDVEIVTERRSHHGRALAVIVANGQFFAGGWNIAPKAMLMDGKFDIQVIDAAKTAAPALVPKIVRGLHLTEPGVRRISAARFRLDTEHPWPIEVDGDAIGNTPVEGRVLGSSITLKI